VNRKLLSVRRLAAFGVLALVAGAAGAQAAGGGPSSANPAAPRAVSAVVPAAPAPWNCRPAGKQPAAAPPSEALKDAFGILRRERTDDDALPARVLKAIERRGWKVVDPNATRLLRADRRARAWVVPVPDVAAMPTVVCRGSSARARARVRARARALGAAAAKPREGLAVVAVGGAPAGGGGALRDLQRGIAPPSIDPCAGPGRDMLGVSGVVPDGVEAVYVTAADGSATRADVRDNGYAFVLPRSRRDDARYLVWTAANGTPHVQPVPAPAMFAHAGRCRGSVAELVQTTPHPWSVECGPVPASSVFSSGPLRRAMPSSVLRARTRRQRAGRDVRIPARPLPAPAPAPLALGLCAPLDVTPFAPVPRAPRPLPLPPRVPRQAPAPGPGPGPGPSAAPAPRGPRGVPAPSAAPVPQAPRAAPVPATPAAPQLAPPRAP